MHFFFLKSIWNNLFVEQFNRALTLMNQAVSGTMQPGAKENVAYLTSTERRLLHFRFDVTDERYVFILF